MNDDSTAIWFGFFLGIIALVGFMGTMSLIVKGCTGQLGDPFLRIEIIHKEKDG